MRDNEMKNEKQTRGNRKIRQNLFSKKCPNNITGELRIYNIQKYDITEKLE